MKKKTVGRPLLYLSKSLDLTKVIILPSTNSVLKSKLYLPTLRFESCIPPEDFVSINYSIHIYILKVFAKSISDNNNAVHRLNFGIKIVLRS